MHVHVNVYVHGIDLEIEVSYKPIPEYEAVIMRFYFFSGMSFMRLLGTDAFLQSPHIFERGGLPALRSLLLSCYE